MTLYCDGCHAIAEVHAFKFTRQGMRQAADEAGWLHNPETLRVFHSKKCWDEFYQPMTSWYQPPSGYALDDQTGEEYEV